VSDGHLLVAGSAGSGVTSTLHTLVAAVLQMPSPPAVYVIDGLGDAAWADVAVHPRCAAAVRTHDRERLWRLLHHLADRRAGQPAALLVIDGVECLRRELEPFERALELDLFERLVAEADTLGVTLLLGTDGVARLPSTLIARCPSRWLMHLHDAHDGAVFGVPATSIPAAIPGRIVRAGPGLANAQVVAPAPLASARKGLARTERLDVLSCRFDGTQLPLSSRCGAVWRVMIGTRFDDLAPLPLDVHDGDHVLIVGPGRTGKSEALVRCVAAWHDAASDDHDAAAIATVMIAPRRSPLVAAGACLHAGVYTSPDGALSQALAEVLTHLAAGRPTLLAIDDAELVHDGDGRLTALIAARTAGLVVVAAGRGDALRQTYGHWTAAVRRSRLGVMLTGASDVDADLFGVVLPRSIPLAARPGLAHVVDRGELVLAQLAGAMS
jgi:S-DNA-T family DNA segregation ATPase FtsK/SpoIIIE